jgi:toxin ParE1/3/4
VYIELTEAADLELTEATAWYLERSREISRAFLQEFVRVKQLVEEAPRRWREIEPGVRRIPFRRFPYALIYVEEPNRVLVLTVMHQRRNPGYWRSRLELHRGS